MQASEGLILAFLKTTGSLLQASNSEVLDSLFSTLQPALSHAVFLSLQWAESHPAPEIRAASLRFLLQLANLPSSLPTSPSSPTSTSSPAHLSLLASLLPGVLSRLVRVTQDASLLQVIAAVIKQKHLTDLFLSDLSEGSVG